MLPAGFDRPLANSGYPASVVRGSVGPPRLVLAQQLERAYYRALSTVLQRDSESQLPGSLHSAGQLDSEEDLQDPTQALASSHETTGRLPTTHPWHRNVPVGPCLRLRSSLSLSRGSRPDPEGQFRIWGLVSWHPGRGGDSHRSCVWQGPGGRGTAAALSLPVSSRASEGTGNGPGGPALVYFRVRWHWVERVSPTVASGAEAR